MYLLDSLLNTSLIINGLRACPLAPYLKYQPAFAKIQHYMLCQDHVISINTDCQKKMEAKNPRALKVNKGSS